MRAPFTAGKSFSVGEPQELFEVDWESTETEPNWDVHPDGESFLFVSRSGGESRQELGPPVVPLELVANWFEELKRLVPH